MKRLIVILLAVFAVPMCALAEGTQNWIQTTYEEFARGTTKGVALRSDGALELAPVFKPLFTTPSTYIWSAVADNEGNLYLGAGAPARVYKITPDGKATVIFEPKELQVQALAIDGNSIYAATSPDGKVYKIERGTASASKPLAEVAAKDESSVPTDPNYTSSLFFDPNTKYIWALAMDPNGRGELYVATGDRGEIFKVSRSGSGSVFFKSDEAHIRTLAFQKNGDLLAGSDGSGLVYRISPAGEGFVLYSAPKKEITAVAVDNDGNIYAAGVGEKRQVPSPAQPQNLNVPPGQPQQQPTPNINPLAATGGSEIYLITADGAPRRLWGGKDDIVYALTFDPRGRLIAGSGNKGRVLAIEKNGDFVDLAKASASQVTAFAPAPDRALYVVSSNLGKAFKMASAPESEGTLESDVFDAKIFSRWGRAEVRGSGSYELMARSGNVDNPDRNWSPWKKVELGKLSVVEAPAARFVQWKVTLRPADRKASASTRVDSVKVFYRPQNVAPEVEDIAVQTGARVNSSSSPRQTSDTVTINLNSNPLPVINQPRVEGPITGQRDRGAVTVRWSAHDDNDDDLVYSLYYRGDGETKWKLLKDNISDRYYSWDAGLLPDGGYIVKVVATDAPSHTPEEALTDARESKRFEVDTTAPRIDALAAKLDGNQLHVSFSANDTFSNIQRAEFSLDAGEWQFVEPVGQLSDSPSETYDFNIPVLMMSADSDPAAKRSKRSKGDSAPEAASATLSNEHVVVVRVYDRFDNVGTSKVVVR
jgi:hypothetical protein